MTGIKRKENFGKALFITAAVFCVFAVAAIFIFLIAKSIPTFKKLGVFRFVFGKTWSPDRLDTYGKVEISGFYGIFTMIVGTLSATIGALLFGGVTGFFTAVFLAFYCPKALKRIFSLIINLLAGIPSVVYGFFGIVFLLPKLSYFAPNNGSGLLATSIILGIMILPTVVSLSKTSLEAVSSGYYQGSLALGATHTQTVFNVMVPSARSGISAALILGVGRAIGETMAVVMVAGNSPTYPTGLFGSFRVLTANIVMEMGYAGELQEGALVATGVVLLLFVLFVNLIFSFALGKKKKAAKSPQAQRENPSKKEYGKYSRFCEKRREWLRNIACRLHLPILGKIAAYASGILSCGALLLVVGFVFSKGIPQLFGNAQLLIGKFEFGSHNVTIFPSFVTTLMAVALSLVVALPLGIMTAIFLNEYARKRNIFVRLVRGAIDVLSGVPSIVYGLFGMITFVPIFGGTSSVLAGSLTVSIMLLPPIVRSTEESLKSVEDSLRAGSLALGAGKVRTILKVVLPSALPGIFSAVILSIGRVVSESAPFLYTMGSVISAVPTSYLDSGATLAVALYQLSGEGWYFAEAYATATVLIVLVLGLNFLAEWIAGRLNKKLKGRSKDEKKESGRRVRADDLRQGRKSVVR